LIVVVFDAARPGKEPVDDPELPASGLDGGAGAQNRLHDEAQADPHCAQRG
jgi:hypothetical protein